LSNSIKIDLLLVDLLIEECTIDLGFLLGLLGDVSILEQVGVVREERTSIHD